MNNNMNFAQMNIGKWMTQRTTYTIKQGLSYVNQSEIIIKNNNETEIINNVEYTAKINIIKRYNIINKIQRDIISLLYDTDQNSLQKIKNQRLDPLLHYMNKDNYISINTRFGNLYGKEKLWLVNPNLRLGINIIKKENKCIAITFSSDIRIM